MTENQGPDGPDADIVTGVTDGAYALVVADYADTESAWSAYEDLKSVEDGRASVTLEVTCGEEKVLGMPRAVVLLDGPAGG